MPPERLTSAQARRIALHAQGFGERRPTGRVDRRHVRRVLDRIGLIQIDSVNVLVRSQELPLFARLGPHPRDLLWRMAADVELFEFWCHEASLLPIEHHPLVRWRMAEAREHMWGAIRSIMRDHPGYVEAVRDEVRDRGPISAGELSDPGTKLDTMWSWSRGKRALEYLFWTGEVSARRRPSDFARLYDLTERIIPAAVLARPTPTEHEARRSLLAMAARHLGVATARDLCDYHRLNVPRDRPRLRELVEEGTLVPVDVEGWRQPALMHRDAHLPRWLRSRALLSPFDSLVWERDRVQRLFGFRYRIEIYTPAAKRVHGYYVLPFLLGDRLVARVDLKADRAAGTLLVQSAYAEPGVDEGDVAEALAAELASMAGWLELDDVRLAGRGDLSPALAAALTSPSAA
ncbi:MAG: YcaQ family DNA glycosylase [Actinobacteria bacterium]|nr:YcaQ family DNA glycosylase [Actinomycetota bacterium]